MSDGEKKEPAAPFILGVCANFANKSGWNVWAVRLIWALGALVLSPVVAGLFYLFTWWLIKEDDA